MNNQYGSSNNVQYQQVVNQENNIVNEPKKKNKGLIIGLSIVGVLILLVTIYVYLFKISEKQENVWESGTVSIMKTNIQLPCDIATFEQSLNTKIVKDEISDDYGTVKLNTSLGKQLKFQVMYQNNKVVGILLETNGGLDLYKNDRDVASLITFPGGVNISSDINEVKEKYKTKPLNIWYNPFSEKINGWISSTHDYHNDEWQIAVDTMKKVDSNEEVIVGIDYWQLTEDDF